MRISKKAVQMNIALNSWRYTQQEINDMLKKGKIFWLDDAVNVRHDVPDGTEMFRIPTNDLDEIKVVVDEYGMYTTVAVSKNGEELYVSL